MNESLQMQYELQSTRILELEAEVQCNSLSTSFMDILCPHSSTHTQSQSQSESESHSESHTQPQSESESHSESYSESQLSQSQTFESRVVTALETPSICTHRGSQEFIHEDAQTDTQRQAGTHATTEPGTDLPTDVLQDTQVDTQVVTQTEAQADAQIQVSLSEDNHLSKVEDVDRAIKEEVIDMDQVDMVEDAIKNAVDVVASINVEGVNNLNKLHESIEVPDDDNIDTSKEVNDSIQSRQFVVEEELTLQQNTKYELVQVDLQQLTEDSVQDYVQGSVQDCVCQASQANEPDKDLQRVGRAEDGPQIELEKAKGPSVTELQEELKTSENRSLKVETQVEQKQFTLQVMPQALHMPQGPVSQTMQPQEDLPMDVNTSSLPSSTLAPSPSLSAFIPLVDETRTQATTESSLQVLSSVPVSTHRNTTASTSTQDVVSKPSLVRSEGQKLLITPSIQIQLTSINAKPSPSCSSSSSLSTFQTVHEDQLSLRESEEDFIVDSFGKLISEEEKVKDGDTVMGSAPKQSMANDMVIKEETSATIQNKTEVTQVERETQTEVSEVVEINVGEVAETEVTPEVVVNQGAAQARRAEEVDEIETDTKEGMRVEDFIETGETIAETEELTTIEDTSEPGEREARETREAKETNETKETKDSGDAGYAIGTANIEETEDAAKAGSVGETGEKTESREVGELAEAGAAGRIKIGRAVAQQQVWCRSSRASLFLDRKKHHLGISSAYHYYYPSSTQQQQQCKQHLQTTQQ